jgi:hypothetical protein
MSEQIVENAGARPWDILPNEDTAWFTRFEKFRLMLPEDRSLLALYNMEKARRKRLGTLSSMPSYETFKRIAKEFKWVLRARESDKVEIEKGRATAEYVRAEESRSAEEERAIQRQQRRQLMDLMFKQILTALQDKGFDLTKAKLSEVLQFTKVFLQQNREEYDATPGKIAKYQYNTLTDQELYALVKERVARLTQPT